MGSGAVVLTDTPKDHHGGGEAFSPSDLLSASLGACILSMMGIAAREIGIDLVGAKATITKRMGNAPRRILGIDALIEVPRAVTGAHRAKLEAAAHACPVHEVLAVEAPISIQWASD
jgi:uncharacterized OsmC-like protein